MKPFSDKNYKFVKSVFPYPSEIPELFGNHNNDTKLVSSKNDEGSIKEEEFNKNNDLFLTIRPFLIFGKCIGLVPISGVFRGGLEHLKFR